MWQPLNVQLDFAALPILLPGILAHAHAMQAATCCHQLRCVDDPTGSRLLAATHSVSHGPDAEGDAHCQALTALCWHSLSPARHQ